MHIDEIPLDQLTDEQVRTAYIEKLSSQPTGVTGLLPDIFWDSGALHLYQQAAAWWPKDAPLSLALPRVSELFPYGMGPATAARVTARDALNILGSRCTQWLESEGRDPQHPNESKQQSQRRRAAEAMRRSRQLRQSAAVDPRAERVRQLYAVYIAACAARKQALADVHSQHDPLVKRAAEEWARAKADLAAGVRDEDRAIVDASADSVSDGASAPHDEQPHDED